MITNVGAEQEWPHGYTEHTRTHIHFNSFFILYIYIYPSFWDIDVLFVFNLQRLVFASVRPVKDAGPQTVHGAHFNSISARSNVFQKAKNVKVDLYRCERFIEHDACGRCFRNFLLDNNEIKSFNVFHASLFLL